MSSVAVKTPPPFYADLGKDASDMLTKDFPAGAEVKVEATAADGTKVVSKLSRCDDGTFCGSFNPSGQVGYITDASWSATIHSCKKTELELTLRDKLVAGTKTILKAVAGSFLEPAKATANVKVEYAHERAAVTAGLDVITAPPKKGQVASDLHLSVVAPIKDFFVGIHADVGVINTENAGLNGITTLVGAKKADYEWTFYRAVADNITYGATLHQRISNASCLAANLTFADNKNPGLTFGQSFLLTSGGKLKAKASTNGRVGVSYAAPLSPLLTATVGLDVNSSDTKDHKVGFALSLKK